MLCPFCNHVETKVIDSRLTENNQIRRRRECISCLCRFTSYETVELSFPRILKKNGDYVQFDKKKLKIGILRAVEKRPISSEQIDEIVNSICKHLLKDNKSTISSHKIGDLVMKQLKLIDHVAYIRFASVYRQFQEVREFSEEVTSLTELS